MGEFVYVAEENDTVKSVAEKFHTAPSCLISINGLTEEIVKGEILKVEKTDGKEYVVKPKDTFESVSGYNDEKAREIKSKNKTDVLYVGQTIYI